MPSGRHRKSYDTELADLDSRATYDIITDEELEKAVVNNLPDSYFNYRVGVEIHFGYESNGAKGSVAEALAMKAMGRKALWQKHSKGRARGVKNSKGEPVYVKVKNDKMWRAAKSLQCARTVRPPVPLLCRGYDAKWGHVNK